MPNKIILRVAASPLTPAHLACALHKLPGVGFSAEDAPHLTPNYHSAAVQALVESIESDGHFQNAIRGAIYKPTNKPIARLTPRNQFMALAPALLICNAADGDPNPLASQDPMRDAVNTILFAPFVISFAILPALRAMRAEDADPATSMMKLEGFIEHHLGAAAALFVE